MFHPILLCFYSLSLTSTSLSNKDTWTHTHTHTSADTGCMLVCTLFWLFLDRQLIWLNGDKHQHVMYFKRWNLKGTLHSLRLLTDMHSVFSLSLHHFPSLFLNSWFPCFMLLASINLLCCTVNNMPWEQDHFISPPNLYSTIFTNNASNGSLAGHHPLRCRDTQRKYISDEGMNTLL